MERIEMYKIREIFRLVKEKNSSCRDIADILNIGKSTANNFIKKIKECCLSYEDISGLSDSDVLELLDIGVVNKSERYKYISDRFAYYDKELKRHGVTLKLLWEEYIEKTPEGYSLSQFCHHFQMWRGSTKSTMHIEHKAGDKMFVDFTGDHLYITDIKTGKLESVEVFVAVLGASNLTYVEAVRSQEKKEFIKSVESAIWYFGGVTKAIVTDSLKSAVTKADKYEPKINRDFHDFAMHYNTVILPARPYSPKDKALVEGAVKIVYSWIFAKLRNRIFNSIKELNLAILQLLEEYNSKPMQRTKISRIELFNDVEKAELKPLPLALFEFKMYAKLTVPTNYHIHLSKDKHYYSVPFKYIKKIVDVRYNENEVEIYYDNIRIASHKRSFDIKNKYSTMKEHMPPNHRFYSEWSPERFLNWAEKIGEDTKIYIKTILDSREYPEQAFRVCLGILNLSKKYGEDKLNKACKKALYFNVFRLDFVKNTLVTNSLELENYDLFEKISIDHENIRGNKYYDKIGGIK